jgi:hypothetical protein
MAKNKVKYTLDERKKGYYACLELDEEGNLSVRIDGWYVITFNTDGTFSRVSSIAEDTKLRVNEMGRIIERTSDYDEEDDAVNEYNGN